MSSDKSNRFNDALGARPNQPQVEIEVERREHKGPTEAGGLVKRAGRMLAPDGYERVASYCVHIYKHQFSLNLEFRSQNLAGDHEERKFDLRPIEANLAIKELSQIVAKSFGWTPGKRESKLIKER